MFQIGPFVERGRFSADNEPKLHNILYHKVAFLWSQKSDPELQGAQPQRVQLPWSEGMDPRMLEPSVLPFLHVFSSAARGPSFSSVSGPLLQQGSSQSSTVWLLSLCGSSAQMLPGSSSCCRFPTLRRSVLHQEKELGHFFPHLDEFLVYIRFNFSWRFYIVI